MSVIGVVYQWFYSQYNLSKCGKQEEPGKVREFKDRPEKLGKGQEFWKLTKKSGNFIKLTDLQTSNRTNFTPILEAECA